MFDVPPYKLVMSIYWIIVSYLSLKYIDISLSLYIMLKKESFAYDTSDGSRTGVHAIVVKVVVPQPKMSRFTITIDVSTMTLWP
jgi:hypothetical protein